MGGHHGRGYPRDGTGAGRSNGPRGRPADRWPTPQRLPFPIDPCTHGGDGNPRPDPLAQRQPARVRLPAAHPAGCSPCQHRAPVAKPQRATSVREDRVRGAHARRRRERAWNGCAAHHGRRRRPNPLHPDGQGDDGRPSTDRVAAPRTDEADPFRTASGTQVLASCAMEGGANVTSWNPPPPGRMWPLRVQALRNGLPRGRHRRHPSARGDDAPPRNGDPRDCMTRRGRSPG